jgi:pimeloyl-ACP methyl ester carboxylesterase
VRERFVEVHGLPLCLCSWGEPEDPLILCLHGFLDQGAAWAGVGEAVAAEGFHFVAPDARGHGRSGHVGPGGAYHFTDYLLDIDGILADLGQRPRVLVGHSMGGTAASLYAGVRPDRMDALVVVEGLGPVGDPLSDDIKRLRLHLDQVGTRPTHPVFATVEEAVTRMNRFNPGVDPAVALFLAGRTLEEVEGGWRWTWDPLHRARFATAFLQDRYLQVLTEVTVPTTLVLGDSSWYNSDELPAREAALPQLVERITLSGGHALHHDDPLSLARVLTEAAAAVNPEVEAP